MDDPLNEEFARRALESRALSREDVDRCLQARGSDPSRTLADVAVGEGFLDSARAAELAASLPGLGRIGEMALRRGYVTGEQLDDCLQDQHRRPADMLGQILLRKRYLTTSQFLELLREQKYAGRVPQKIGRYAVRDVLGEGGMGIVYLARDSELGREVALKVLRAGEGAGLRLIERFHREAQNAARLSHPGIVTVYEAGRDGETLYIAMEYARGLSYTAWRHQKAPDLRTAVEVLEHVARAAHAAHEQGVIHRDLKPGNIIVDDRDRPRLLDFGLSRSLEDDRDLTRTGSALGTPFYMSPEQARGDLRSVDARSDVFALGVLLYETIAGVLPFDGDTSIEVYQKIAGFDPPRPSSVRRSIPREIEAVCLKAIEKEKHRRYATALALAEDLRRWLDGEPVTARPASTLRRLLGRARRNPAASAAIGAAALLAAAGAAALLVLLGKWSEERSRLDAARRARDAARPHFEAGRALLEQARAHFENVPDPALRRTRELSHKAAASLRLAVAADGLFFEAHHLLGQALELAGDAEGARRAYLRTLEVEPAYFDANFDLAEHCLMKYSGAVSPKFIARLSGGELLERRPEESPEAVRLREQAMALLQAAADRIGDDRRRRTALALVAASADRHEEALRGFDEAAEEEPGYSRHHFRRGEALYALERFDEAVEAYSQAIRLCVNHVSALAHRGVAHEALANREKAARRDPTPHLRRALEDYNRTLEIWPDNAEIASNRGCVWRRLGDADRALADLDLAIERRPGDPYFLCNRAAVHSDRGDHERAIRDLDRAIELRPSVAEFLLERAAQHTRLGDREKALADADRGVEMAPDRPALRFRRASIRQGFEEIEGALADYDEILRLDPAHLKARMNRATLRRKRGELEAALEDADRAVDIDPGYSRAYFARGNVRFDLKRYDDAIADYTRAIERESGEGDFYWNRGWARFQKGEYREAIDDWTEAARLKPSYQERAQERIAEARRRLPK